VRRVLLLPAAALLAVAAVPLPLLARLAPGMDGVAVATGLATWSGWAVAAVVAVGAPPLLVAAAESSGLPHAALAPVVGRPRRAVATTLAAALAAVGAGLPAAGLAHRLGGPPLAALLPGGCALAAAAAPLLLGRRLAATPRLALAYGATAAALALLGGLG